MTTPVVGVIQYSCYGVTMNRKLMGTLGIVVVGIIIVTCNEVELRFWGLIYAACGVLSTSFYQVWVKTRQQDLGLFNFTLAEEHDVTFTNCDRSIPSAVAILSSSDIRGDGVFSDSVVRSHIHSERTSVRGTHC